MTTITLLAIESPLLYTTILMTFPMVISISMVFLISSIDLLEGSDE